MNHRIGLPSALLSLLALVTACTEAAGGLARKQVLGQRCESESDCESGFCEPRAAGPGRICCALDCTGGRSCESDGLRCPLCNADECESGCGPARCGLHLELGERCDADAQCGSGSCSADYFGDLRCCDSDCDTQWGSCNELGECVCPSFTIDVSGECLLLDGEVCSFDGECASGSCSECGGGMFVCSTGECTSPVPVTQLDDPVQSESDDDSTDNPGESDSNASEQDESLNPAGDEADSTAETDPPEPAPETPGAEEFEPPAGDEPESLTPSGDESVPAADDGEPTEAPPQTDDLIPSEDDPDATPDVLDPAETPEPTDTTGCDVELLENPGFEKGIAPWVQYSTVASDQLINSWDVSVEVLGALPRAGDYLAWLAGWANVVERLSQTITVPERAVTLKLSGYRMYKSAGDISGVQDFMNVQLAHESELRQIFFEWNNETAESVTQWEYFEEQVDAAAYQGGPVSLELYCSTGSEPHSNFYFDDLSLVATCD